MIKKHFYINDKNEKRKIEIEEHVNNEIEVNENENAQVLEDTKKECQIEKLNDIVSNDNEESSSDDSSWISTDFSVAHSSNEEECEFDIDNVCKDRTNLKNDHVKTHDRN